MIRRHGDITPLSAGRRDRDDVDDALAPPPEVAALQELARAERHPLIDLIPTPLLRVARNRVATILTGRGWQLAKAPSLICPRST
jgi:hypothetical protein